MPCNLAARADARISNKALAKLLTPQVIEQAVRAFARSRGLSGEITVYPQAPFRICIGGDIQVTVYVNQTGFTVQVTGYNRRKEENQTLADQITQFFVTVTGALMQQQVVNALRSKFAVEEIQKAANGAVVVTMEM